MNLAEFVANLKADGGLLPWSPRTEFAPKSLLGPSLGVNGRCVDWTRRDCLASLTISAHDFLKLLRRGVKALQTPCLVSIELSQFAHSGLGDYQNLPFQKIILCTYTCIYFFRYFISSKVCAFMHVKTIKFLPINLILYCSLGLFSALRQSCLHLFFLDRRSIEHPVDCSLSIH